MVVIEVLKKKIRFLVTGPKKPSKGTSNFVKLSLISRKENGHGSYIRKWCSRTQEKTIAHSETIPQ